MSIFTSGCSAWYSFAASMRVASTQTVSAPSFWAACANPSLVVPVAPPPPPQAVTVSSMVAAQPASSAARLLLVPVSRATEGL
jgi:hypothetical protein